MQTLLLSLLLFFQPPASDPPSTVRIKTSAICEMCKERIERNLSLSKGVKEANLNLDDKVVTVAYNPSKTDVAAIRKVINETGYDADEVSADPKGYAKLPSCCKKGGEKLMKH